MSHAFHHHVMLPFTRLWRLAMLLALGLGWLAGALPAHAQPTPGSFQATQPSCSNGTYGPLNTRGLADTLTLDCSFATDADTVTIYSRSGLDTTRPWLDNLDAENATWVFDAGSRNRASLIIRFLRATGDHLFAEIYDDQNGDHQVAFSASGNQVEIEESERWSMQVESLDGWWERDGKPSFNLDIRIDSQILAAFHYQDTLPTLSNDGRLDYLITVRDPDTDGQPDYQITQTSPWQVQGPGYNTLISANPSDDETPITNAIIWPFLGSVFDAISYYTDPTPTDIPFAEAGDQSVGLIKGYNQSFPPIQVSWPQARIAYVGEFVASRGNDHNWFVYSLARLRADTLVTANFEAPFAFYDLANDDDGYPELEVRSEYFGPYDPKFRNGSFPQPINEIRYSWDQDNNQSWDYKVSLSGTHVQDELVQFPEVQFRSIGYEHFPSWVISKQWSSATFVAAEKNYWTSEGIYEWPTNDIRNAYLNETDTRSMDYYAAITPGLRGEYRLSGEQQASLYFSPVDHKLHLAGADAGVWQLAPHTSIAYGNTNKGGSFDQMTYSQVVTSTVGTATETVTTTRQLNIAATHLLYSGENQVVVRAARVPGSLFETLPPTTHDEWATLGAQLDAAKPTFAPDDFLAMMQQFPGEELSISNAAMHEYRNIGADAFRFRLSLLPGFQVRGSLLLPLDGLAPGEYLVSYENGFSIAPAAASTYELGLQVRQNQQIDTLSPLLLELEAHNTGTDELRNATAVLSVQPADGSQATGIGSTEVDRQTFDVLAEDTNSIAFRWQPPIAGTWNVQVQLFPANTTTPIQTLETSITIPEQPFVDGSEVLELSSAQGWRNPAFLLLLGVFGLVGLAAFLIGTKRHG